MVASTKTAARRGPASVHKCKGQAAPTCQSTGQGPASNHICSESMALQEHGEQGQLLGMQPPVSDLRPRLRGKQAPPPDAEVPPCRDIVVWIPRRIRGKQPRPEARASVHAALGHYDVLGIHRSATATEVLQAYKRQVLATHPDKGGNPADFRRVRDAFVELHDPSKRAAYNQSLDCFGRRDGRNVEPTVETSAFDVDSEQGEDAQHFFGASRAMHAKLLRSEPKDWPWWFKRTQLTVLRTMHDILLGKKRPVAEDEEMGFTAEDKMPGITVSKTGYKVEVAWDNPKHQRYNVDLVISTGLTKSVSQALDWQISLLDHKEMSQAKMQRNRTLDPLVEEELLGVLRAQPDIELTFTISARTGGSKGKKISAPGVQDLALAMDFRRRFLELLAARKPQSALEQFKQCANAEASSGKQRLRESERQLLAAVKTELRSRGFNEPRPASEQAAKKRKLAPPTELLSLEASVDTPSEVPVTPITMAAVPTFSPPKIAKATTECLPAHQETQNAGVVTQTEKNAQLAAKRQKEEAAKQEAAQQKAAQLEAAALEAAKLPAARQEAAKQELAKQAAAREGADRERVARAASRAKEVAEKKAEEAAAKELARQAGKEHRAREAAEAARCAEEQRLARLAAETAHERRARETAEADKRAEREIERFRRERADRRLEDDRLARQSQRQVRPRVARDAAGALFSRQGRSAAVQNEAEDMSFLDFRWPSPPRGRLTWCDDEE